MTKSGYVAYQKAGYAITYHLPDSQILWKKNRSSYPFFDPYGRWIFLVNSDRSAVEVLDLQGSSLHLFEGLFLVDLQCSHTENHCFILFNDGKLYFFHDTNSYLHLLPDEKRFYKSVYAGNHKFAVHFLENNKDVFEIYGYEFRNGTFRTYLLTSLQSHSIFPLTIPFFLTGDSLIIPYGKVTYLLGKEANFKIFRDPGKDDYTTLPAEADDTFPLTATFLGDGISLQDIVIVAKSGAIEFYSSYGILFFIDWSKQVFPSVFFYKNRILIFVEEHILEIMF